MIHFLPKVKYICLSLIYWTCMFFLLMLKMNTWNIPTNDAREISHKGQTLLLLLLRKRGYFLSPFTLCYVIYYYIVYLRRILSLTCLHDLSGHHTWQPLWSMSGLCQCKQGEWWTMTYIYESILQNPVCLVCAPCLIKANQLKSPQLLWPLLISAPWQIKATVIPPVGTPCCIFMVKK